MRDQRGWNQGKLSAEMGKPQSVVSRLEDPSYGKVTVQTLLEVAATFDVALQIRFVPFSTFIQQTRDVSTQSMKVVSFDDDFSTKGSNVIKIPSRTEGRLVRVGEFDAPTEGAAWRDVPTTTTKFGVEIRAQ